MNSILERRTAKRIKYKATVMIEIRDTANFHYATMNNLSGDGIYCGSDCALKLGTPITIRLENQPFASAPKIYLGEVMRCQELKGFYDSHLYGLGIKIINTLQDREIEYSHMAFNSKILINQKVKDRPEF